MNAALALLVLYAVGVQYERGGPWRVLFPLAMLVLLASWLINQTVGRVIYGKPATWRETFTKHTARTLAQPGWRGRIARLVAAVLNFFAHDERHVK